MEEEEGRKWTYNDVMKRNIDRKGSRHKKSKRKERKKRDIHRESHTKRETERQRPCRMHAIVRIQRPVGHAQIEPKEERIEIQVCFHGPSFCVSSCQG